MRLSDTDVRAIVIKDIVTKEEPGIVYYIDTGVRLKDTSYTVGINEYRMKSDSILVFIDDFPGLNWAHPCRYLIFDIETGEFIEIKETFPPKVDQVVGDWSVIFKPEQLPDWKLVTY